MAEFCGLTRGYVCLSPYIVGEPGEFRPPRTPRIQPAIPMSITLTGATNTVTYECFTMPLADGSIGLCVLFRHFDSEEAVQDFMEEFAALFDPDGGKPTTLH